jgi:hypothetical protein
MRQFPEATVMERPINPGIILNSTDFMVKKFSSWVKIFRKD